MREVVCQVLQMIVLVAEVYFLGHIVNQKDILLDLAKIETIMRWEVPRTPYNIRIFLGLVGYYRRFIYNFYKIVLPFTRLTKKNVTFQWSLNQQLAFETLRYRLCEALILTLPKGMDDFVVYYFTSILALGVVLT